MRNKIAIIVFCLIAASAVASGQNIERELKLSTGQTLEIVNRFGRVEIVSEPASESDPASVESVDASVNGSTEGEQPEALTEKPEKKSGPAIGRLSILSKDELVESEIISTGANGNFLIEVKPKSLSKRIDLKLTIPERIKLDIQTRDGSIVVDGNFEVIRAVTDTGTIAVDVPTDDLKYEMVWTTSKPRFLADFEIAEVKERSGGRFQIKGHYPDENSENGKVKEPETKRSSSKPEPPIVVSSNVEKSELTASGNGDDSKSSDKKKDKKPKKAKPGSNALKTVSLNFTTARGIVLLNVPPNEVMSDLRERPLTEAAKAIVRSGDAYLIDAIRRASPKHFSDYSKNLPAPKMLPTLTATEKRADIERANIKTATARVFDVQNRAISDLKPEDFEVTESGQPREILSVRPVTSPVNLVLLLDVSGSVDTYVNFIRKAARAFVNTVDPGDRVSIVLFNDDVKELTGFTTNRTRLSESLDTFDAGGGTAYYDAIGFTLTETLRPLKGDRTAIVILTDGDDNRSFLPFDSLAGSIEESGALIYPLYVPTSLAAVGATQDLNAAVDPLRQRYLNVSLTSKADEEGAKLAKISGGVYYPISELSQIQKAYEDIVLQLRTAYDIKFRSQVVEEQSRTGAGNNRPSPRLKIRVKRPDTFVQINRVHY
ncbi:MAG: VWA domain-containing protein [Pyrinomonadaceae bacterium]